MRLCSKVNGLCAHTLAHVEFLFGNPQRGFWFYFWFTRKKAPVSKWDVHRDLNGSKVTTYVYIGNIWLWENSPLGCKWVPWGVFTDLILKWIKILRIKGQLEGNGTWVNKAAHQQLSYTIPEANLKSAAAGTDPTRVSGGLVAPKGKSSSTFQHRGRPWGCKGGKMRRMGSNHQVAGQVCVLWQWGKPLADAKGRQVGEELEESCLLLHKSPSGLAPWEWPRTEHGAEDISHPTGLGKQDVSCALSQSCALPGTAIRPPRIRGKLQLLSRSWKSIIREE